MIVNADLCRIRDHAMQLACEGSERDKLTAREIRKLLAAVANHQCDDRREMRRQAAQRGREHLLRELEAQTKPREGDPHASE